MKALLATAALCLTAGSAFAQSEVSSASSRAASVGPTEYFTGTALVEPVFDPIENRNFAMAAVTFMPGARSNWHTHPSGQTLVVTSGTGWTQVEGEERLTINAGDVVWCPPGERHWHGATDTTAMSHLAIQQVQGGSVVDWMEPVTDEQYLGD